MMVRVVVHADHDSIAEIVSEVENHSNLSLTDTANVNILEAEILVSRVRRSKVEKSLSHEKSSFDINCTCGGGQ